MSDLMERLRATPTRPQVPMDLGNGQTIFVPGLGHYTEDDALRREAAAEIARLTERCDAYKEALVQTLPLLENCDSTRGWNIEADRIANVVRAALATLKDKTP